MERVGLDHRPLGRVPLADEHLELEVELDADPEVMLGIVWTAITATVMFALAYGKNRTGQALGNPVLLTEGRVTVIDGLLACAVLLGLLLNLVAGWWWADPAAGLVIVYYALREPRTVLTGEAD